MESESEFGRGMNTDDERERRKHRRFHDSDEERKADEDWEKMSKEGYDPEHDEDWKRYERIQGIIEIK